MSANRRCAAEVASRPSIVATRITGCCRSTDQIASRTNGAIAAGSAAVRTTSDMTRSPNGHWPAGT
jgi:hypothetical protein